MMKLSFPKNPGIMILSIVLALWIWAYVKSEIHSKPKNQEAIFKNYHVIPKE
jgi:hypothetical protein